MAIFTLVSAVVFHVILAQGQLQLDSLEREISSARREYEVAATEDVDPRIAAGGSSRSRSGSASSVPDDPPTYLLVPGATAAPSVGGETTTTLGDWKKVKPSLGSPP